MSSFKALNEKLNIVDVVSRHQVIKNGKILCPSSKHNDTNPSMVVNESTNTVYCFTCKTLLDCIGYYSEVNKVTMMEAAKTLAAEAGLDFFAQVEDPKAKKRKEFVTRAAEKIDSRHIDYLSKRGIELRGVSQFNIGGAGDWIVQPIYDDNNKLVFYNKRHIANRQHFIEAGVEKSSYVGGLHITKNMSGPIVVTEGYFDVVQAWQEDIRAVNIFGASLSETQAKKLLTYTDDIILALDNDDTGVSGALEAFRLIKELSPTSQVMFAEFEGKDLGEHLYINDEISSISYYQWAKKNGRSMKETLYTVTNFMSPMEKRLNVLEISSDLGVTVNDVYAEMELV